MLPKFSRLFALGLSLVSMVHANDNDSISSSGGKYFDHRLEIAVPAFAQDDPRWSAVRLGVSTDTLGDEGCAVTSAAMVASIFGVKTDPQKLNDFLTRTGGLDNDGLIDWSMVASVAPDRLELAYNGCASFDIIDTSLLSGNPVIVVIPLQDGAYHFVVIVGKIGRNYLIRDPADSARPYPLCRRTDKISSICIFRSARLSR